MARRLVLVLGYYTVILLFAKELKWRYNQPMLEETKSLPERSSILRALGEFLRLGLIAAAIALPIRYFVAQPFIVRGASMEPNFHEREYLIIDEISYFFRKPARGEVVVFRYPLNPREYFIKRVIGLPGEIVEVKEGRVFIINEDYPEGFRLEEPYLLSGFETRSNVRFALAAGEYVVLGDNRPFSSDSRSWGALDREFIAGRVVFRAFPFSKFGPVTSRQLFY